MKIEVAILTKDKDGNVTATEPIGQHAISPKHLPKGSKSSPVLDTNEIGFAGILIDFNKKIFQCWLCLGGRSDDGTFHQSPDFGQAQVSIQGGRSSSESEFWQSNLDGAKGLDFDRLKLGLLTPPAGQSDKPSVVEVVGKAVWKLDNLAARLIDDAGKVLIDFPSLKPPAKLDAKTIASVGDPAGPVTSGTVSDPQEVTK